MIIDYQKVHILRKFIIFPHLHSFRHENTKDKREANPEAWDLQEEEVYMEPRQGFHAGVDPPPEQPAKYVQLFFSWSVAASILNLFYRISVKNCNRNDPRKYLLTLEL